MTAARATSIGAPGYSQTFPSVPESAGLARDLVATALRVWRLESLLNEATLVATELVANAVQHGSGRYLVFSVEWPAQYRLRIRVTDQSHVRPVLQSPSEEGTRGRGLLLVAAVAAEWGTDVHTSGKTVWADLADEAGT
ncbi:ATP-binding protein [Streptomyces sp. PU-14G]|uniref:ATP-binding protein n=1 Tax=Streptomyces sp. PU-14G TaxID=2800808 RepID=UPI0034DE9C9D